MAYCPDLLLYPIPTMHAWGRGWELYPHATCDVCGYAWAAIVAVGEHGKHCPACGYNDVDHVWESDTDEMPNDGCWIDVADDA